MQAFYAVQSYSYCPKYIPDAFTADFQLAMKQTNKTGNFPKAQLTDRMD